MSFIDQLRNGVASVRKRKRDEEERAHLEAKRKASEYFENTLKPRMLADATAGHTAYTLEECSNELKSLLESEGFTVSQSGGCNGSYYRVFWVR